MRTLPPGYIHGREERHGEIYDGGHFAREVLWRVPHHGGVSFDGLPALPYQGGTTLTKGVYGAQTEIRCSEVMDRVGGAAHPGDSHGVALHGARRVVRSACSRRGV